MRKIKLCCFTVNTTHALIIANNFIERKLSNVKIIYINEREETKKIKRIINKFYKNMQNRMYYSEWLNEDILNDYSNEEFVFVVHGKEQFVENANKFLDINEFNGYIINCYDVYDIKKEVNEIIDNHDYYMNTTGVIKKEICKDINEASKKEEQNRNIL
ncbi:MAG: hypothetical protein PHR25_05060 [Clostridia bacterium]|nr:hypothetical protein [Clostridia bacterium]MDD4376134.1 hypothetical protein [Clostridia bacterium]